MQYTLDNRRTYITSIEFRNISPILNINRLRSFKEEGVTGSFTKKEFRYSFDNVIWSPWQSFTTANLTGINFSDQSNFYIHIKYSRSSVIAGNIDVIYINYDSRDTTSTRTLYYIDYEYVDGSLNDIRATYIPDASFGSNFTWNSSGYLDTSIVLISYEYVDSSLSARDASIVVAFEKNSAQDASIIRIDVSLGTIYPLVFKTNASLGDVTSRVNYLDACLGPVSELVYVINSSLSYYTLVSQLNITDTSLYSIDQLTYALNTSTGNYATNVSVGLAFASNASLGNLTVQFNYLDACLGPMSELTYALNTSTGHYATNASVNRAFASNASIGRIDASLITIYPLVFKTNASLGDLTQTKFDASIAYLTSWNSTQDASIERIDASLSNIVNKSGDTMSGGLTINASLNTLGYYADGSEGFSGLLVLYDTSIAVFKNGILVSINK